MKKRTQGRRQQVIDLVKAKPGLTREQLATELKMAQSHLDNTVRELVTAGILRATKKLGRGPPGQVYPADAEALAETGGEAPKPKGKRRRASLLVSMPLGDFKRFCEAADLTLEQGLALGYRLIVQQLTGQLAERRPR